MSYPEIEEENIRPSFFSHLVTRCLQFLLMIPIRCTFARYCGGFDLKRWKFRV